MQAQSKPKQADWFAKMQQKTMGETGRLPSLEKLKIISQSKNRCGLSKEEEIQIGLEMIPMFEAKAEELQSKRDRIQNLKAEFKEFSEEQGYKPRFI